MEQVINVFAALVRSEIGRIPLKAEEKEMLNADMMKELYRVAQKHDIVYLVAVALKKQKLLGDDEISKMFLQHIYVTLLRYEAIKTEQEEVYAVFEQAEIIFVPLKGAVLREYYPEPWMRTSCDIDILVKEADLERAREALSSSLGYTVEKYNYHDISMYSPAGIQLELHFQIVENMDPLDGLLEKVWDYVNPIAPECFHQVMTPEYLIFHVLAHMCYHFVNGGCGVRFLMDMWLLENRLSYDKEKLLNLYRFCDLEQFASYVRKLSSVWFEGKEPDEITRMMETYMINGGVFGSLETKVMARKTRDEGQVKYLVGRIFMPYKEACGSFPKLKKYPLLYPYYMLSRWLKLLNQQKAQQTKAEIRLNQSMEVTQIKQLKRLFAHLELEQLTGSTIHEKDNAV